MTKFFDFKGANIHYTDEGNGKTLVFLHGFLCNHRIWKSFIKDLKSKYRVINIDLPGHGKSDSIGYLHSMELMADVVFELLRSLKVRKSNLIGHSMGGYVALAFLEKYPDNCKSLCLFNSSARSDSPERQADRTRAISVIKKNHELYVKTVVPNLFYTEKKPFKRDINTVLGMALETSHQGIVASQEGMKIRANREIIVHFAPCPIHYIIGENDQILKYPEMKQESTLGEKTSHYTVKNGGHMCMYEDKAESFKSLFNFLKTNA